MLLSKKIEIDLLTFCRTTTTRAIRWTITNRYNLFCLLCYFS